MSYVKQWIRRNRFFAYGVPFMVLLVGGSFVLQQFAQLRYTFRKRQLLSREEAEQLGIKIKLGKEAPTLEEEFEKTKQMNIDNWSNVRGPRPWEPETFKPVVSST